METDQLIQVEIYGQSYNLRGEGEIGSIRGFRDGKEQWCKFILPEKVDERCPPS